jgi:hypothetical protein
MSNRLGKYGFAALALGFAAAGNAMAADVPADVRAQIEKHAVAVRVIEKATRAPVDYGSGMIVGEKDGRFAILTAAHVLYPEGLAADEIQIEVQFVRRSEWNAVTRPVVVPAEDLDAAVVEVDVALSPFEPNSIGTRMTLSPPSMFDEHREAWAYGYDVDEKKHVWLEGATTVVDEAHVYFNADDLKRGYSGGVLVSSLGPIGVITAAGPNNRNHEAIFLSALAPVLQQGGIACALSAQPVLDAMINLMERELTAGLFIWDESERLMGFWAAVRLTAREGMRFDGDVLGPSNGAACALTWEPGGLRAEWGDDGGGVRWSGSRFELSSLAAFTPTDEVVVDGFIVLQAIAPDVIAYLALPIGFSELAGSALIAAGAKADWRRCDPPGDSDSALAVFGSPADVLVQGRRPDFPLTMRPNQPLPLALREEPILAETRIAGTFSVGDVYRTLEGYDRVAYQHEFQISGAFSGRVFARGELEPDKSPRATFMAEIPREEDRTIEVRSGRASPVRPVLLEACRIEYSARW